MRRSTCILTIFMLLSSGCLGLGHADGNNVWKVECSRARVCQLDGPILIEGLAADAHKSKQGLSLSARGHDITLQDIDLTTGGVGIHLEMMECTDCSILLRNVSISAKTVGLHVNGTFARLALENVSIEITGGDYSLPPPPEGFPHDPSQVSYEHREPLGISITPDRWPEVMRGVVDVENVRISAVPASGGMGIAADNVYIDRWEVQNLSISGFRTAARLWPSSAAVSNLEIDCVVHGWLTNIYEVMTHLDMENVVIRGCATRGMDIGGFQTANLNRILIDGARVGMRNNAHAVSISNFTIRNVEHGLVQALSQPGSSMRVWNGLVENATYTGLRLTADATDIQWLEVRNAGHGWPDPYDETNGYFGDQAGAYGGLVLFSTLGQEQENDVIRNSTFEGNAPYGFASHNLADARHNWWGSSDGPQVYVYETGRPGVGFGGNGDNVTAYYGTMFWPYLESPPVYPGIRGYPDEAEAGRRVEYP